jgi:Copper amine oxidase, N2 domain
MQNADKANSNDNQILLIEVLQPNKTDVLNYLNGGSAPPDRWARVVIVQSATEPALIVNYKVYSSSTSKLLSFFFAFLFLTRFRTGWTTAD